MSKIILLDSLPAGTQAFEDRDLNGDSLPGPWILNSRQCPKIRLAHFAGDSRRVTGWKLLDLSSGAVERLDWPSKGRVHNLSHLYDLNAAAYVSGDSLFVVSTTDVKVMKETRIDVEHRRIHGIWSGRHPGEVLIYDVEFTPSRQELAERLEQRRLPDMQVTAACLWRLGRDESKSIVTREWLRERPISMAVGGSPKRCYVSFHHGGGEVIGLQKMVKKRIELPRGCFLQTQASGDVYGWSLFDQGIFRVDRRNRIQWVSYLGRNFSISPDRRHAVLFSEGCLFAGVVGAPFARVLACSESWGDPTYQVHWATDSIYAVGLPFMEGGHRILLIGDFQSKSFSIVSIPQGEFVTL